MSRNSVLWVLLVLSSVAALGRNAQAVEQIVELRLQRARCLCGVVVYPNGDPVAGAKIEELGEGWKGSLRSIRADAKGSFVLGPVGGRKVYYLQITAPVPGVNPLRVPVQIVQFRGTNSLRLRLNLA